MSVHNNSSSSIEEKWRQIYPFLSFMLDPDVIEEKRASEDTAGLHKYIASEIQKTAKKLALALEAQDIDTIVKYFFQEIDGYGPIESLMRDETITDILINAYNEIYVERAGRLVLTDLQFCNQQHIDDFMLRLLFKSSAHLNAAEPYVDFQLDDGSRINIITEPLVQNGPAISIRKFHYSRFNLNELVEVGSLTLQAANFLKLAVQGHLNVLIAGGTGTGKTTLMNAMLHEVGEHERIVSIEDTYELSLQNQHAVRMLSKIPTVDGIGEVTQRDLLRNALRMRPDRIIIGEIRGPEILEMLQSMNTGINGSIATIHAGSTKELPIRLANILTISEIHMPISALTAQLATTLDLTIQLKKRPDYGRYVAEIFAVVGEKDGQLDLMPIYQAKVNPKTKQLDSQFLQSALPSHITDRLADHGIYEAQINACLKGVL